MDGKPVLEVVADDEGILESLKSMGVNRIVAFSSEKVVYQYPTKTDVSDLTAFATSVLTILNDSGPWLAFKQGLNSIIIFRKNGLVVAVEGAMSPADYDVIVMLVRLLNME